MSKNRYFSSAVAAISITMTIAIFLSGCSSPIKTLNHQKTIEQYLKTTPPSPNISSIPNPKNMVNQENTENISLSPPANQITSHRLPLKWLPLPNINSNSNPSNIFFNDLNLNGMTKNDLDQALAQDNLDGFWPAWLANCTKLIRQSKWQNACYQAQNINVMDITAQKQYLKQYLSAQKMPLRLGEQSKITGYYEPFLKASRQPNATYRYPIYQKPNDLYNQNIQQMTRQELLQSSVLLGSELIYLANPVDAALIEIQGSALIELDQNTNQEALQNISQNLYKYDMNNLYPSSSPTWVRVAFDGANQHNFKSFIQYLLTKKYINRSEMAIPSLRIWANNNPFLIQEAIQSNPRFIFFKNIEYNQGGPIGAYGLALTPQRSIAVDRDYIELGSPMVIKFNHPILGSIHRFVIAQDVGNAIKGSVRADFFWGLGEDALKLANATNAEGELIYLQPKI